MKTLFYIYRIIFLQNIRINFEYRLNLSFLGQGSWFSVILWGLNLHFGLCFFFPFGDFCYSCHHNHSITNWAGQILTWIDPQNASAAPVWILCSNSGFPYLSLCVCASRVGWSAPAVKLSCRTRWTSRSSSTPTPSSMLCARKPPGNDSRLPTPDSHILDAATECKASTLSAVPWLVLWMAWCLCRRGGVPSARPSCRSR